jgi:Tfp pilus assembly protein PilP
VLPRNSHGSGMSPRWVTHLRYVPAFAMIMSFGLSGCTGESTPGPAMPARPTQAPAAKPATPEATAAPKPPAPPYAYEAKGRRDPFRPLIAPRVAEVKSRPKTGLAALEVNELKLAGVVWEQRGYFALVEAPNGAGYVLRINDTVGGGARVTRITPQTVTFEVGVEMKGGPAPSQPARTRVVELRLRKEE